MASEPEDHLCTRRPNLCPVRIDVFSIFPGMIEGFCSHSLLGKARAGGQVDLRVHDPREYTTDVHRSVDDAPFGGGAGMVMRAAPIFAADLVVEFDLTVQGSGHRMLLVRLVAGAVWLPRSAPSGIRSYSKVGRWKAPSDRAAQDRPSRSAVTRVGSCSGRAREEGAPAGGALCQFNTGI